MEKGKKFILGQYFTKRMIVDKVINLLLKYKTIKKEIRILEPSSGTGNFVNGLKDKGFINITNCEIDPALTKSPRDFFIFPIEDKFDLIIGNPPFTKYNIKNSYYSPNNYLNSSIKPSEYIPKLLEKKNKIQIENVFILKSIKHLSKDGTIAFVLPISFFIARKNKEIKKELINNFSTMVIYQNNENWFDESIPCCFVIFTNNNDKYKNKIILLYEDGGDVEEVLDKSKLLTDELIPKSFLYKKNNHQEGTLLSEYLSNEKTRYNKDYNKNNVSGANILNKTKIPKGKDVKDYYLAIVRVGNSSIGKTGLINIKEDVLNDMFYVFGFKEELNNNKEIKEKVCSIINQNQEYLRNSTVRVGSKSIKKDDLFNLRIIV